MAFPWLHRWARSRKDRFFPDGETYDLQERLERKQRPAGLRDTIAGILKEPNEELRSAARFQVWKAETGPGWEVVTDHCCLGDCDLNVYSFPSERDALLFARLLDAVGYRSPHNIACPACYAEYMKNCV